MSAFAGVDPLVNVLHCVHSIRPETGGPARSVPALVRGLRGQGVDARLAIGDGTTAELPAREEIPVFRDLQESLTPDWRPDLIHDHGVWLPCNHRVAAFSQRFGIPRIVSPRGMLEPWSLNHGRLKKRIAWWAYQHRDLRRAKCLHATSHDEAANLRGLGLPAPIAVIPNGVELPESKPRNRAAEPRTILFLSRIHPKKGLPLLIEAWSQIRDPGWRIRIVGPDERDHSAELRSLIAQHHLSGVVTIERELNDLEKWSALSRCDLFVLPTYSENFGIVVAEALASSRPVITTTGTPWRQLSTERCGWWVEPAMESIRDALKSAIQLSDSERAAMGERGRQLVARDYSWVAIAANMRLVYESILSGAALPASLAA